MLKVLWFLLRHFFYRKLQFQTEHLGNLAKGLQGGVSLSPLNFVQGVYADPRQFRQGLLLDT